MRTNAALPEPPTGRAALKTGLRAGFLFSDIINFRALIGDPTPINARTSRQRENTRVIKTSENRVLSAKHPKHH